jgi:signal transduction histidine kinase
MGWTGERPRPVIRLRDTLTGRLVLLGVLTALVSVLAVAVVGVPLVRSEALAQARVTLSDEADYLSGLVRLSVDRDDLAAAVTQLDELGVRADVVGPEEVDDSGLPVDVLRRTLATGGAGGTSQDGRTLVEARLVSPERILILKKPAADAIDDVAGPLLGRLAVALVVGLVVAAVAGVLAARRLARPLRDTRDAARRLSTGERSLRVQTDGPVEVVDLADALNGLADALERSESRQRRFLLSVSHEMRTPLTSVRGYAEALADGVVSGPEAERAGAVIVTEARRLDSLMSDLLALARSDADDFQVDLVATDLAALVDQAAQAWSEPCRQAGLDLRTETPNGPVAALADPMRTRQVIDALVANAVRATPAGRPVVIAAAHAVDGRPWMQVRDGGPGLTDEDLPVAFDSGVLRDRYEGSRAGGSGIGLALVERLVRRMGGHVVAGHAPEGGAAFMATLQPIPSTS